MQSFPVEQTVGVDSDQRHRTGLDGKITHLIELVTEVDRIQAEAETMHNQLRSSELFSKGERKR